MIDNSLFQNLTDTELDDTNGGVGPLAVVGAVCSVVGGTLAVLQFAYWLGEKRGINKAYTERYGKL